MPRQTLQGKIYAAIGEVAYSPSMAVDILFSIDSANAPSITTVRKYMRKYKCVKTLKQMKIPQTCNAGPEWIPKSKLVKLANKWGMDTTYSKLEEAAINLNYPS